VGRGGPRRTAPLYWARYGTAEHLGDLFALAERLRGDTDELVAKPVGIALKYAGLRDEPALRAFLARHEGRMRRSTLRHARQKLTG
jgi:3-methyladenine DNA glycosylase AlkD